ncbi:hypothetical protein ACRAWF_23000 [Streptomyces sp. L7]
MSGGQQADGQQSDLVVGEGGVLGLSSHQIGDDVLAGVLPLEPGQAVGVFRELPHPGLGGGCAPQVRDLLGQPTEVGAVGVRHTEQVADHQRGQRERQQLVQVHRLIVSSLARGLHLVEALLGQFLDPRGELPHPWCGERGHQEPAHPVVLLLLGVVCVQTGAGQCVV